MVPEASFYRNPEEITTPKPRILIMDDEEGILSVTGKMLTFLGYDYTCARNGTEAISLYREALATGNIFALIILDLTIKSGLGGIQTLSTLRALDPKVKAIVSSGFFLETSLSDYRRYGFIEVLQKPYRLSDLQEALRKVL